VLYPVFVNLKGKSVLVVGAGSVAIAKLSPLLSSGADVVVVAPRAQQAVLRMAEHGEVQFVQRAFVSDDVKGRSLVVAASNNPVVNETVMRSCREHGVWVNVVDDPARCDFFVPSMVNRGRLHVAISTEGASPAFARRLRRELDHWLHESLDQYVDLLEEGRKRIRALVPEPAARRSANEALLESGARTALECGDAEGARAAIARVLAHIEQKRAEA
jgi:precorrin-2 dehydrogenase / sirohydrochlorin ferrochelatase